MSRSDDNNEKKVSSPQTASFCQNLVGLSVQRTTYYDVYSVEYHMLYLQYQYLTLAEHVECLRQLQPIYALAEEKIKNEKKIAKCPDDLKIGFDISKGMEADIKYFKTVLSSTDDEVTQLELKNEYLPYLRELHCPYELLGQYMVFLGLNIYGGASSDGIVRTEQLKKICDNAKSDLKTESFPFLKFSQPIGTLGIKMANWVSNSVCGSQQMAAVLRGYGRAFHYIRNIFDEVSRNSQGFTSMQEKYTDGASILSSLEEDMLQKIEYLANRGKTATEFKKKGYNSIIALDVEKVFYQELFNLPRSMKKLREQLKPDSLCLSVAKDGYLQAFSFKNGQSQQILEIKEVTREQFRVARNKSTGEVEQTQEMAIMIAKLLEKLPLTCRRILINSIYPGIVTLVFFIVYSKIKSEIFKNITSNRFTMRFAFVSGICNIIFTLLCGTILRGCSKYKQNEKAIHKWTFLSYLFLGVLSGVSSKAKLKISCLPTQSVDWKQSLFFCFGSAISNGFVALVYYSGLRLSLLDRSENLSSSSSSTRDLAIATIPLSVRMVGLGGSATSSSSASTFSASRNSSGSNNCNSSAPMTLNETSVR